MQHILINCKTCGKQLDRRKKSYCSVPCRDQGYLIPLEERFFSHVHRGSPEECWPWKAAVFENGYGQFAGTTAHRTAWKLRNGEIPHGTEICHKCDNPICVNPDHLFLGTHLDNMRDKHRKGRHRNGRSFVVKKIDEQTVNAIRNSTDKNYIVAAAYGLNRSTISRIRSHKTWARV